MLALTEKQALIQALGRVVFDEVKAAIAPLNDRITLLEKTIGDLAVAKGGPLGEASGGESQPVDAEYVRQYVAGALEAFGRAAKGDNDAGHTDIKDSLLADLRRCVADLVAEAVGGLPKSRDCVGTVIDRAGHLQLSFSDGSLVDVGPIVGRDGQDGAPGPKGDPGTDGIGFDVIAFEKIDERTYRLVVGNAAGDKCKTFDIIVPGQIQRGMWNEETAYDAGDCVTLGGSQWCAKGSNKGSRPTTDNDDWFLSVKRGADGKQGVQGPKGQDGVNGRPGRDLTQMTFEGQKY